MTTRNEAKAAVCRRRAAQYEEQAEEFRQLSSQLAAESYDLSLAYNCAHESLKRLAASLKTRAGELDESETQ